MYTEYNIWHGRVWWGAFIGGRRVFVCEDRFEFIIKDIGFGWVSVGFLRISDKTRNADVFSHTCFNVWPKGFGVRLQAFTYNLIKVAAVGLGYCFIGLSAEVPQFFPVTIFTRTFGFGVHFVTFTLQTYDIFGDVREVEFTFSEFGRNVSSN